MAFADAAFDRHAELDGVRAVRARDLEHVSRALAARGAIPVYVRPWRPLLAKLGHRVLVDARMRKHSEPEVQIGYVLAGARQGRRPLPLGRDGEGGAERQHEAADPEPGHHAVDLDLDGGVGAVAGEIAQDEIEVFPEPEAVVHRGDGRLLLRVKLLGRGEHDQPAPY